MRLREVLDVFEQAGPMSLAEMSRRYNVDRGVLEEMIGFWVRKGRLRDACSAGGCGSCHANSTCTLVVSLPHRYELVTPDRDPDA